MEIIGVSPSELLVIVLVALIIFGPHRLPEMARHVGRVMRMFRKASEELRRNLDLNFDDLPRPRDFRMDTDSPIEREYQTRFGRREPAEPEPAPPPESAPQSPDPLKVSPPPDAPAPDAARADGGIGADEQDQP